MAVLRDRPGRQPCFARSRKAVGGRSLQPGRDEQGRCVTVGRPRLRPDRLNQINLSLFGLAGGARILDLGCARGEQSILLAERGFNVVGADSDPALLDMFTKEAAARG